MSRKPPSHGVPASARATAAGESSTPSGSDRTTALPPPATDPATEPPPAGASSAAVPSGRAGGPAPESVTAVLMLRMAAADEQGTAIVPTLFRFDPGASLEVRLVFHCDTPEPIEWVFSRSLLAAGLRGPAGRGDVRLRPHLCPDHGPVLRLMLASPHGEAVLEAPAPGVAAWLDRTCALVPPGSEVSPRLSDEDLRRLTGG